MSTDPVQRFEQDVRGNIERLGADRALRADTLAWMVRAGETGAYTYNFRWLGRPIIQYPQDMVALQEVIWQVRPDLVVETGIAHGGSLVLSASMLALLDYCDALRDGVVLDPRAPARRVLGVDIDIRAHNRAAIEAHPLGNRIDLVQGSSVDEAVLAQVRAAAARHARALVVLDSNHTHEHVLAELEAYAPLVSPGSYCVVFDTLVEDMPEALVSDRPWGKGNSPRTAVWEYLRRLREEGRRASDGAALALAPDRAIEDKLLITVAPDGYLRRPD
jgi:cephalosporin hydroxylase